MMIDDRLLTTFFSPDFSTSKYCSIFMKLGTHVPWMIPLGAFFHFSKIPPLSPPGGELPPFSPPESPVPKYFPIAFKFGMSVLYHNTNEMVRSIFGNSPIFPPGGEGELPPKIHPLQILSDCFEIWFACSQLQ